jgi:ABC-2 type transport system ATP-binding protein
VNAALRVRGVAKHFGDVQALRGISFDAAAGEVVAVVGPNGAGKTTLLSIIAGTHRPDAGSVERTSPAAARGADIGWVPQQPALYSKLSVTENLSLFAHLEKVADPAASVQQMLEQAGLAERAGERLENLSGGNRQRVNVAIGLIADPPVLALDEPSAALDPGQRERLWEFIGARAKRGTSVLFSTHIASEAQRYADRLIVLDDGELLFDGAPQAFMAEAGERDGDIERALIAFLAARSR